MKSEILYGRYKTKAAKERGVLSIDCPVTDEDAKELKKRFGIYTARSKATQEKCASCVFCREVYDNFCKCVFEDWKKQPESVQEAFVSAGKQNVNIDL